MDNIRVEKMDELWTTNFPLVGRYGIPQMEPVHADELPEDMQWQPFNEAMRGNKGNCVHFYIHDYRFEKVWYRPNAYNNALLKFDVLCAPDFSLYANIPDAVNIYNHYRKHFCAAYWQEHGMTVLPSLCWNNPDSYEWCFDGEPTHGVVTISSVGVNKSLEDIKGFLHGYDAALERLQPELVLFFGPVPSGCRGNIMRIEPQWQRWTERSRTANARRNEPQRVEIILQAAHAAGIVIDPESDKYNESAVIYRGLTFTKKNMKPDEMRAALITGFYAYKNS